MEYPVPRVVAYLVAWFSFTGGVWALFERAEAVLQEEAKQELGEWTKGQLQIIQDWPTTFARAFDAVFGNRHLTLKCFFRSCLASLIAILITTLILRAATSTPWSMNFKEAALFAGTALALNGVTDYVSLLETRFLVGLMAKRRFFGRTALILLDITLSFLIFALNFFMIAFFLFISTNQDPSIYLVDILADFPAFMRDITLFRDLSPFPSSLPLQPLFAAPSICLYSTFFTSIWLWLLYLSCILGRVANTLGILFDFESKPLRSLGFIAVIISTLGFTLLPLIL